MPELPNGWLLRDNSLNRRWQFQSFVEAFAFMTKVAALAEEHDHHPDWRNSYSTVEISLTSHDAGNVVTDRDYRLAAAINEIP